MPNNSAAPPWAATAEDARLAADDARQENWKSWGPYLAERQWATVREDYSADGDPWRYFPHDHARSRAYRWGEDGLLGICDRQCRLAFGLALWNGRDPILKERLFGLTGPEGNHGEDVKECYYYLDSTPTHSYLQALYKYPQAEFPYAQLVAENARRDKFAGEFELEETGAFREGRYWDVQAEYAKASPTDILIRLTVANRGPEAATLHLLPQIWFRNTWSWGCTHEGCEVKPWLTRAGASAVSTEHVSLGEYTWHAEPHRGVLPTLLFTENETNFARLFREPNAVPYVKDAFHDYVVQGRHDAVSPREQGTKAGALYVLEVPAGESRVVRLRLHQEADSAVAPFDDFDAIFSARQREADEFYATRIPSQLGDAEKRVARQAYAGLLWSKQFYHYSVVDWAEGDPDQPKPPPGKRSRLNADWRHLFNRDVILMPDKWEYPWYAAWDLAFHCVAVAEVDAALAKQQLLLLLREWYMHPNGQMPAYEFNFSDVNPPVHAWACWRVYKMTGPRGARDRVFLARAFHKLLLNFTWWVNRKDDEGNHLFSGGFLGLDNIGLFDRSQHIPGGGQLEQADGTAWMGFYCATLLSMALELAAEDPAYEDVASKFFEHFVAIVDAINRLGGTGLWDEADGFFYDRLHLHNQCVPLRVRSLVGLLPLIAVEVLDDAVIERLPGFQNRMQWFLKNRPEMAQYVTLMERCCPQGSAQTLRLLAFPSRERLRKILHYLCDEEEFLSPFGIRSLSKVHRHRPASFAIDGQVYTVAYDPGESTTGMFGGNSNWRGPVWLPINYLIVEALERYHHFLGDEYQVEFPTGSGRRMSLDQIARQIGRRVATLFLPDSHGRRPCHGDERRYADDPHWKDLVLFHEYFHGDTGRGLGAAHQTGWTALAARFIEYCCR